MVPNTIQCNSDVKVNRYSLTQCFDEQCLHPNLVPFLCSKIENSLFVLILKKMESLNPSLLFFDIKIDESTLGGIQ